MIHFWNILNILLNVGNFCCLVLIFCTLFVSISQMPHPIMSVICIFHIHVDRVITARLWHSYNLLKLQFHYIHNYFILNLPYWFCFNLHWNIEQFNLNCRLEFLYQYYIFFSWPTKSLVLACVIKSDFRSDGITLTQLNVR